MSQNESYAEQSQASIKNSQVPLSETKDLINTANELTLNPHSRSIGVYPKLAG